MQTIVLYAVDVVVTNLDRHAVRVFNVPDKPAMDVYDDTPMARTARMLLQGSQLLTNRSQQIPGIARIGVLPLFASGGEVVDPVAGGNGITAFGVGGQGSLAYIAGYNQAVYSAGGLFVFDAVNLLEPVGTDPQPRLIAHTVPPDLNNYDEDQDYLPRTVEYGAVLADGPYIYVGPKRADPERFASPSLVVFDVGPFSVGGDLAAFAACYSGPGVPAAAGCEFFDAARLLAIELALIDRAVQSRASNQSRACKQAVQVHSNPSNAADHPRTEPNP